MMIVLSLLAIYFAANLLLMVAARCIGPLNRSEAVDMLLRGWPMLIYILFSHRD